MVSAVLQTSFLGDMILTTPLLARLAERGRVVVVATPANAALLTNHPAVSDVIVFDKRGADRGVGGVLRVARALRATGAERAYIAQGSMRTAALARLAGIRERVGFETSPGRVLYSARVPFRRELHHAQRLWQLASARDDASAPRVRPSLFPSHGDRMSVSRLLEAHAIDATTPFVVLAPGSVWATKRWPSFDALAAALALHPALQEHRVVVIGAAGDAPLARAIGESLAAAGAPPAVDATGKLSLLGSAALLSRARGLVTNDSAPLHLASAMDTPTVALFGPTIPAFGFGPLASRTSVFEQTTLECRPCHAHGPQRCPLEHWRCMRDSSADQVASALVALTR